MSHSPGITCHIPTFNPPSPQQNNPQDRRTQPPHPPRATHPLASATPFERPQPIGLAVCGRPNNGGIPRRKHDGQVVGAHDIDLLGREHRVGNGIAGRTGDTGGDAVGDGDGDVEDGVVVLAVETEVLADGDLGSVSVVEGRE